MKPAFLSIWAAFGPLVGVCLGAYLGPYLAQKWTHEQWRRDKQLAEYKELMATLAEAYITLVQRAKSNAQYEERNGPPEEPDWQEPLPIEIELLSYRMLHDRVFIAQELRDADIFGLWDAAITNFRFKPNEKLFAKRYLEIVDKIMQLASKV